VRVLIAMSVAGFLFGLFTLLRARDREGCTGNCVGCTRHGACATTDGVKE
jgi:hypothetical protein